MADAHVPEPRAIVLAGLSGRGLTPAGTLTGVRVKWLVVLAAVAALAGCGDDATVALRKEQPVHFRSFQAQRPLLSDSFLRSPDAKTDMDTNAANLASAVVTAGLGQLPVYIDGGAFRLLPFDLNQASEPGRTLVSKYRITLPRTRMVVDTVSVASPTRSETRSLARDWDVRVSLDGRYVRDPHRFWIFYRNNGPQICRIYFPGDLGSLQMGANSFVLNPLPAGSHVLRVEVAQWMSKRLPVARIVRVYSLHVLDRPPGPREAAIAPDEEGPPPETNRTPLAFRTQAST